MGTIEKVIINPNMKVSSLKTDTSRRYDLNTNQWGPVNNKVYK